MRKVSEPSVAICPECKQETFEKMLSAPSFKLSGSGWYATDFKGDSKNPAEKSESTEAVTTEKPAASCAPGCACH